MSLKQFYIKNFQRSKAVIVMLVHEDQRLSKHWCIKYSDNTVKITDTPHAIVIDKNARYLSTKNNIPTYLVHHSNCECILVENQKEVFYTATELNLILEADEAKKVMNATSQGTISSEAMIILVVIVLGFLGMFYFFNTKLESIDEKVTPAPIVEVVEDANEVIPSE